MSRCDLAHSSSCKRGMNFRVRIFGQLGITALRGCQLASHSIETNRIRQGFSVPLPSAIAGSNSIPTICYLSPAITSVPGLAAAWSEVLWRRREVRLGVTETARVAFKTHPRIHPKLRRLTRKYRCLGGIPCAVKLLKVKVRCRLTRKRSLVRIQSCHRALLRRTGDGLA